ncbi:MAG: DUF1573 domain-containing protein [candidate division Zixibacteria bacterium]|nr:DUF1573 domain-containing protein [candidate division Zixibacteria bacterium]
MWFLLAVSQTLAASEHARLVGSEFDFGVVPQNATLAHQVWLYAGADDTLRLVDIKTGCGCLTAPWEETRIAPKDSLLLVLYWQTRAFDGYRAVSAFFFVEPEPYPLEVVLSGKIVTQPDPEASLILTPWRIDFRDRSGNKLNEEVTMTNRSSEELTLTLAETGLGIEVEIPKRIGAGQSVKLQVRRADADSASVLETSFTVEAAGNPTAKQRVSVPVVHGDLSFRSVFTTTKK